MVTSYRTIRNIIFFVVLFPTLPTISFLVRNTFPIQRFKNQNQQLSNTIASSSLLQPLQLSSTEIAYESPKLKAALVKPSKILTVCLEYYSSNGSAITNVDLATLSMQLRKSKAASIWSNNVQALTEFVKEQSSALGNFPGPCPVIYNGYEESQRKEAILAGVDGVVVSITDLEKVSQIMELSKEFKKDHNLELIWEVQSMDEASKIIESGHGHAFLLPTISSPSDREQIQNILSVLPKKVPKIIPELAMQTNGSEVGNGRSYKALGCTSILVQKASVGDSEDVPYATFVVDGLTSKKSSQFQMTGLTGSANGHFGGVEAKGEVKWRRTETE